MLVIIQDNTYMEDVTGLQLVRADTKVVASVPFDCSAIDYDGITVMDFVDIPYNSSALRQAIAPLVYDIADDNGWQYPDLEYTKMTITLDPTRICCDTMLTVEVAPMQWAADERAEILATADRTPPFADSPDPDERNWSEYNNWLHIFGIADAYYMAEGTDRHEPYGYYNLALTPDEQQTLLWTVVCKMYDMIEIG